MSLNLAALKARGLRDPSKCAHLLGELSNFSVNVASVQETHFTCTADCQVLEDDYFTLLAFGSCSSIGVSLLIGRCLNADVKLVLADDRGPLVVADVFVKSFQFWVAGAHVPCIVVEKGSFSRLRYHGWEGNQFFLGFILFVFWVFFSPIPIVFICCTYIIFVNKFIHFHLGFLSRFFSWRKCGILVVAACLAKNDCVYCIVWLGRQLWLARAP